jgi:hypothetical protein
MATILATDKGHAMTTEIKSQWTVWVGGVEVNDYYMTETDAQKLADEYKAAGYDDATAQEVI